MKPDDEKTVQELADEHYRAEQRLAVDKFYEPDRYAERDANDLWDALHPL